MNELILGARYIDVLLYNDVILFDSFRFIFYVENHSSQKAGWYYGRNALPHHKTGTGSASRIFNALKIPVTFFLFF